MMAGMFPMEVLQTSRQTTIIQEAFNQVRRIYHDDAVPTIEDAEPRFWGIPQAIGKRKRFRRRNGWDQGTRSLSGCSALRKPALHPERMRRIDADHFENEVVLEDPEYLTEPWRWKWIYQRRPNYKMYEYVCEDNQSTQIRKPESNACASTRSSRQGVEQFDRDDGGTRSTRRESALQAARAIPGQ